MSIPTKEGAGFGPAITFEDVWVGFDEGQVLRGVTFQVQERETLILLGETKGFDCQGADQPAADRAVRFTNGGTRPGDVTDNHYPDSAAARCLWSYSAAGHASFAGRFCAGEFSFRSGNQTGRSQRSKWQC